MPKMFANKVHVRVVKAFLNQYINSMITLRSGCIVDVDMLGKRDWNH